MYDYSFFKFEIDETILSRPAYISLRKDGAGKKELPATCFRAVAVDRPPSVTAECTASDTSTSSYEANEIVLYIIIDEFVGAYLNVAYIKTALVTKASEDRLDVKVTLELKQAS